MKTSTVLISGAGIAGATLAWWLARNGFSPTVVERAERIRSSGAPVDVRGQALETVTAMGLAKSLRDAATGVRELTFIDGRGRRTARADIATLSDAPDGIELPRGDLARILYEAGSHDAEYIFNDEIAMFNETPEGVDIRLGSGLERHFDLLIGADGLHSRVRKLAFGPETMFVRHVGLYVATMPLFDERPDSGKVLFYNCPGRAIAIHPARNNPLCAFIFHHPQVPDLDPSDITQHKGVLKTVYGNQGWRSDEFVEKAIAADDLYFDSVSRVQIDKWSRGSIALLGDAASCLSLFGGWSSLAIAGAQILARELGGTPDHSTAFQRYEQQHRRAVEPQLGNVGIASRLLVPKTAAGIAVRNRAIGLLPLFFRMFRSISSKR